jgi:dipeptidyl-peptidase-4
MTSSESQMRPRLTLKKIFQDQEFKEISLRSPHWMQDNRRLAYLNEWPESKQTTIWIFDSQTLSRTPLLDPLRLIGEGMEKPIVIHSFIWSPCERYLLFTQEAPARFKSHGNLYLYDLYEERFRILTRTDLPQRGAKFSPDSQWIGVAREDNLWLICVETGEERPLTFDASPTRYNGRLGWVYEEELSLNDGWVWSPDSRHIAYYQQDESEVPEVLLPQYDDLHGRPRITRYPKAGDPNPKTRIGILTLDNAETRWLPISSHPAETGEEFYLARIQWTPDGGGLLVQRIPRLQNRLELLYVDGASEEVRPVLVEEDPAWVDPSGDLTFLPAAPPAPAQFLWLSDRDGYKHLYLYDLQGNCLRQLTAGAWNVTGIFGISQADRQVFFQAALPAHTERSLYRTSLDGGEPIRLTDSDGWHSAHFTKNASRYIHSHSTLNLPTRTAIREADGSLIEECVADSLPGWDSLTDARWELFSFTATDGETLYGRMLKPADFDPLQRYPVLMYNYGGPESQVVTNSWGGKGGLWYHFLAQEGFLVCAVDNRGTGARAREFAKIIYLKLGQWETRDQIEGAKYLASLPYVRADRIGIWGWSYGGYMAALCLLKGADVFHAATAVAPVTDWTLYDTIYTERYLRRPADNPDGYREGSPVTHAEQLKGRLLLIHGTMDDNVHFQNSARLASALQDAGKTFETMFYPGKHHGIEDRHLHLYTLMTEFFCRHLRDS